MAKNLKPYTVPLDADLAAEILSIPIPVADQAEPPRTIGERVAAAVAAVDEANTYLADSSLAAIVADTVMRKLKKRGTPSIRVQPDGTVILHVSYDDAVKPKAKKAPVKQSKRQSALPPLSELRKQAEELGVSIDDLGRARRAIYERLQVARASVEEDSTGNDVKPPERLVDERRSSPAPADKPKTIRRRKGEPDKVVGEDAESLPPEAGDGEVNVDDFLEGL